MSQQNRVVVGLLSHYLEDVNLGCVALSIGNMRLMDQIAEECGLDLEYRLVVNEKHKEITPDFTDTPLEYRYFDSSKETLKHPLRYLRSTVYADCDLVVNINAGDGFTDLYGFPRLISESYMTLLAQRKGVTTVMSPQTIGPFSRGISKALAKRVMSRCATVYSRDGLSTALCHDMGLGDRSIEVIDVAFALPYQPADIGPKPSTGLSVGVNVSGLLYRGGYDRQNYFGLAFDYKGFIDALVGRLLADGHSVHLVPHVTAAPDSIEDDHSACEEVARAHPGAICAPKFTDAIAVKSYIASLDLFTGARMHSTIAAFSSGVPVVPIGYSKKLNGLYDTLDYPYYIDARDTRWTAESAVQQILEWSENVDVLGARVASGAEIVEARLAKYRATLGEIMTAASRPS